MPSSNYGDMITAGHTFGALAHDCHHFAPFAHAYARADFADLGLAAVTGGELAAGFGIVADAIGDVFAALNFGGALEAVRAGRFGRDVFKQAVDEALGQFVIPRVQRAGRVVLLDAAGAERCDGGKQ